MRRRRGCGRFPCHPTTKMTKKRTRTKMMRKKTNTKAILYHRRVS